MDTTNQLPNNFNTDYMQHFMQNVETAPNMVERCQHFVLLFKHLLQFPDLVTTQPELSFTVRQKAKEVEPSVSDLIAAETIPFDLGCEMVQLAQGLLQMTSSLADFDFEEAQVTHTNNNTDENCWDTDDDEEIDADAH